jgi:predicted AAA+ superfamily ATPase
MKRKIEDRLQEWKSSKNALPLMLVGAKQTGKTYICMQRIVLKVINCPEKSIENKENGR